jgi:hypothetical protein
MHACIHTALCTTSALNQIIRSVRPVITAAALDRPNWTSAQFSHAVLLLLNREHSAVSKQYMELQLGRHMTNGVSKQQLEGEAVLAALVKAEWLSLQHYSDWAVDIPHTAHRLDNDNIEYDIVTAPSPVELYYMKSIQPQLERTLQSWEQQQQKQQVCSV